MLKKLTALFGLNPKNEPEPQADDVGYAKNSLQYAVAALLVEAARADDDYADGEKSVIDQSLMETFSLPLAEAQTLRAQGEIAQQDSIDLHRFTKIAKQMSVEEKSAFVENLWRIVLSDGTRDQYEDALIRRLCGLIYFDDRLSGEARQRAAEHLEQTQQL